MEQLIFFRDFEVGPIVKVVRIHEYIDPWSYPGSISIHPVYHQLNCGNNLGVTYGLEKKIKKLKFFLQKMQKSGMPWTSPRNL